MNRFFRDADIAYMEYCENSLYLGTLDELQSFYEDGNSSGGGGSK